jgi:hypothetical protein
VDLPPLVAIFDVKVHFQEVVDGEVGSCLAIGDRTTFEQEPAVGTRRPRELVEQAGLAHPWLPNDGDDLPVAGPRLLQRLV